MARTKLSAKPSSSRKEPRLLLSKKIKKLSHPRDKNAPGVKRNKPRFRSITLTLRGIRHCQKETKACVGPTGRRRLFHIAMNNDGVQDANVQPSKYDPPQFNQVSVGDEALETLAYATDSVMTQILHRCNQSNYLERKATLQSMKVEQQFRFWTEDNSTEVWSRYLALKAKYYGPEEVNERVPKRMHLATINVKKHRSKKRQSSSARSNKEEQKENTKSKSETKSK